jgi:hypothetical protein
MNLLGRARAAELRQEDQALITRSFEDWRKGRRLR